MSGYMVQSKIRGFPTMLKKSIYLLNTSVNQKEVKQTTICVKNPKQWKMTSINNKYVCPKKERKKEKLNKILKHLVASFRGRRKSTRT